MPEHYVEDTIDDFPNEDYDELSPPSQSKLIKYLDAGNIVDELEDNTEATTDAMDLYNKAEASMGPWLKKYKRAINLAKLQAMSGETEIHEKNFPIEGASLAMMPFILEAMLDFSSRAAAELVWAPEIVKAKIYGESKEKKQKEERAKRISDYMNYQLTEMIPHWREDQDKGLFILSSPGTFYKKTYYDPGIQETCSELCLANEVIFNHKYKIFDKAPDKFYPCTYTRSEVIGFIRGKQQWSINEDELEKDEETFDFIEAYTWFDLDGDGLKEPYIALIWKEKERIISLYPRYDEDTITETDDGKIIKIEDVKTFTQYRFLPDPEGGPMGLGWGILLGPMFDSINTNVRQLIDAGTVHITSANSGLVSQPLASGRGNAMESGPIEIELGQLTPVSNHGPGTLRDNIVQFPFSGPSSAVFQLMEYLVTSSRSMTNAAINVEANPGEAASLYLARLQQGLKIPNSIAMRVYECEKQELKLIAALNYKHFDDEKYNKVLDLDQQASMKQDFNPDDCDIRITADPSQGSEIERAQRSSAIYQMAETQTEQIINKREAVIDVLETMGTPNIEKLAPEPDPNYVDPAMKMMIAEKQLEAEMRQKDQDLRRMEADVKKQKVALEAAKEMSRLGLQADKQEAEISKLYAEALEKLVKAGIASGSEAMGVVKEIEGKFIDASNV